MVVVNLLGIFWVVLKFSCCIKVRSDIDMGSLLCKKLICIVEELFIVVYFINRWCSN